MRLVTFQSDSGPRLGVVRDDGVIPVPGLDMLTLIEMGEAGLERARSASGSPLSLASLTLLAPIPAPRRNVFCLGRNYAAHAKERALAGDKDREMKLPEQPIFFTKATTSVNGPFADIPFDAHVSDKIDWEAELGVVVGKQGKNISRQNAMEYVFGYTVINDVSARDVQDGHGGQFFKGKSLDGACPMGPWLVTRDEVPDPHALRVTCRVNGVTKQNATAAEMIFDIPAIIEWLSLGMTLLPGDVIATGTPAGVGSARTPPEFLKPGDVVECEVERIGTIRNRIAAV
jgi:2-keto-4-pentenoate hydratase/2-oxohepta-3-ene-1,7-dioic acid hydratase in catechol pathway